MAVTGATTSVLRAGRRKTGAIVRRGPEAVSQTFQQGALLVRTTGQYIGMGATAQGQSTGLLGFAAQSGQNQTTNGLNDVPYFAFEKGMPVKATMSGAWTGSVHRGLTAGFYMLSGGQVLVKTGGASTCGTIQDAVEWDTGVPVADGDTSPIVYFVPADAAIAL